MSELDAAVDALRPGLWFARVRDVWPEADCAVKDWQWQVPAHVVVAATAAALTHYRESTRRLAGEREVLLRRVRDAQAAAKGLLDVLPPQGELW